MKNPKKYVSLLLALVMCLSLMACGGSGSDDGTDSVPESIENMVIDDSVAYDYSDFWGTWLGEDGATLTVEEYNRIRYDLSDADDEPVAAGDLQYVEEYGYVYANDEHTGIAHQCWFDENNALHIESVGIFTRVSGDVPEETIGDEADCTVLAGTWYLDGDISAASSIDIDYTGTIWSLYERSTDGEWSEVDYGTVRANGDNQYEAVSDAFEDVIYDLYLAEDNAMYWGGENDYYQKI